MKKLSKVTNALLGFLLAPFYLLEEENVTRNCEKDWPD
jgi:hypothetical protein